MTRRLAAPSAGIALLLFLFLVAPPLEAADRDLDRNTVLLLSTENRPALRAAIEASDDGRFLKDPKIQEIINRLQNGFLKLMESGMKEAGAADDEMKIFSQFSSICGEACETLCKAITGRASFSAGFREDSAGGIQPQFIFQCQGGEEISALHRKVLDFFLANDQENELRRTSLRIGGVEFQGFDVVKEHAAGPVVPPDGIYFGHKDGVHTVGISKAGLEEYLSVAAGGKTAAGGRLGDDPLFKRVLAQVGKGELFSFLNARPIWKLLERHHPSLMEGASGGAG
ncbi:MAG: hypothetical protein ACE5GW_10155, partial [Planctomycetota bacterium]